MSDTKQKKKQEKAQVPQEDYKDRYLRALADYHNLEKRASDQMKEHGKRATGALILQLLPALDNLEKAEVFIKDAGLKLVRDQLAQALYSAGLQEIEGLVGALYDPEVAEAIEAVVGETDNLITEVVRKGYKLHDRILRPAQVKVTKKSE